MFVYSSIQVKPSNDVRWFKDAQPAVYNQIVETVRAAEGFISGDWKEDPTNPNRFLITHFWIDKESWKNMSDVLQTLPATQEHNEYKKSFSISTKVKLSE